ncbi:MAG: WecB/TagA/CpsF family glycosyltransferase [Demequina sp.]|uniref:WecB/TagA/CpsF family glycosyltransferase n=1 Tax=Demequina sp. TaxID=2050685 RepID=UPI003A8B478B
MTELLELPALGVAVTPLTSGELITALDRAVQARRRFVIGAHNLHSVYLAQHDARFAEFARRCDLSLVDGMPVLLACRAERRHRFTVEHRIGSTDWIPLLAQAPHVRRIALVGTTEEANRLAVARLQERCPDAVVIGASGHHWGPERAGQVARWLRDSSPDLVLVGLGMPLQEQFLDDFGDLLPPAVYATVGGAIDQLAGTQRNAPRWLGRIGLEWAWRLASQPRRLAHRYLVEPFLLVWILASRRTRVEAS